MCRLVGQGRGAVYRLPSEEEREASDSEESSAGESGEWEEERRPRQSHHHWEGRYNYRTKQKPILNLGKQNLDLCETLA